jgi:type I restriction enzyme, S subunit
MTQPSAMRLGEIISLEYGKPLPEVTRDSAGSVAVAGSNGIQGYHSNALVTGPGIVVGRKGSAGRVNWFSQDFWPIDTTYYIAPRIKLNLRWVYYLLCASNLPELATATGVPGLNRNDVYELPVSVPALHEQARISKLLDDARSLCALRTQAVVRAGELSGAIFEEMFSSKQARAGRWPVKPLGELTSNVSGGTPSTENEEYWSGRIPWISPKDMKSLEIFDTMDHISEAAAQSSRLRILPANTVVVVVRGMILARAFPTAITRVPATINQDMKALTPGDDVTPDYLHWALVASGPDLLDTVSTAGHGTKRLDMDTLLNLRLAVPPQPVQELFSRRIEQVRKLTEEQARSNTLLDNLFYALLEQAFPMET